MPISIWFAGVAVAHSPRWPAEGCVWHSVQENQLVWGGTPPQAFTSASILLRSRQLVTLCATQLHRLALKFNRETIWFSSLCASFHGRIRKPMRRDLPNPFPRLPWLLLQLEMFGVRFVSAERRPWGCLLPHMLLFSQVSTYTPWLGVTGTAANLGFLAAPPGAALSWWVIAAAWPRCTAHQGSAPITSLLIKCINSHETFSIRKIGFFAVSLAVSPPKW